VLEHEYRLAAGLEFTQPELFVPAREAIHRSCG
jgi:hypothetical protein